MADIRLQPFTVGIDNRTDETALSPGAVRDALNVDFDSEGIATRRPGAVLTHAGPTHSLWAGRLAFCVRGNDLCQVIGGSAVPIFALPNSAPLSYCDLRDRIIVSNSSWIGEVLPDLSVRRLGVPEGAMGAVTAGPIGGLPQGRYAIAASYLRDGEEGALSPVNFVQVAQGGGILIAGVPNDEADTIRLYRSSPDGDVLYRAADIPAALLSYTLGVGALGRAVSVNGLRRTPPGSIVRAWNGRLLIARGRAMYITEALNYGVYSPATGFIQESAPITMIAPVLGGVYVGTRDGVLFYQGAAPTDWVRVKLGASAPFAGSDVHIAADILHPRFDAGSTTGAVMWLCPDGYVVGTPSGSLIQPQSSRLAGLSAQRAHTSVFGRRAISIVQ